MSTVIDTRIQDMSSRMQRRINADSRDENGNLPDNIDALDDFLESLIENVIDPHNIRCTMVSPGSDRDISFKWVCDNFGVFVDVNLITLEAELTVINAKEILLFEKYNLDMTENWKHLTDNIKTCVG